MTKAKSTDVGIFLMLVGIWYRLVNQRRELPLLEASVFRADRRASIVVGVPVEPGEVASMSRREP